MQKEKNTVWTSHSRSITSAVTSLNFDLHRILRYQNVYILINNQINSLSRAARQLLIAFAFMHENLTPSHIYYIREIFLERGAHRRVFISRRIRGVFDITHTHTQLSYRLRYLNRRVSTALIILHFCTRCAYVVNFDRSWHAAVAATL